jgi:hypothetical protein
VNLKRQRELILGASTAVRDYWQAQVAAAPADPDELKMCSDYLSGCQRGVDQFAQLLAATTDDDPASHRTPAAPA